MFNWIRKGVSKLDDMLNKPLVDNVNNIKWLELEINEWINCKERKAQIKADEYYRNKQDILDHKRMVINKKGDLEEVSNLVNSKIIDNQYKRLVNQKVNHLVGKPFSVDTKKEGYTEKLDIYFNKKFMKLLKAVMLDGINGGISFIYPYYDDGGELKFKKFKSFEVKVYWKDEDHEEVEAFAHYHKKSVRFANGFTDVLEYVDVYTSNGIKYYKRTDSGTLLPDLTRGNQGLNSYLNYKESTLDGEEITNERLNFERLPLIVFKTNPLEESLLSRVKSLQDMINTILSTFSNNMIEDPRNTILVIKNYDGANLGDFRFNLAAYGAVKVRDGGDLSKLDIEVKAENYKLIIDIFKKAIIQNGGGVDVSELRASGTPNQMNIQSMFYDLELDTNDTETEYQCSLEALKWFIDFDINFKNEGNFFEEQVNFIFNRDMLMDETSIIDNLIKLRGLITDDDIIMQLPFGDASKMIENKKAQDEEEQKQLDDYSMTLNQVVPNKAPNQQVPPVKKVADV